MKLEQMYERRKQVAQLLLPGRCVMEIVALTGVIYPTVRKAIHLFSEGRWSAIKPAARGRSAGDGRLMSIGSSNAPGKEQNAAQISLQRSEMPRCGRFDRNTALRRHFLDRYAGRIHSLRRGVHPDAESIAPTAGTLCAQDGRLAPQGLRNPSIDFIASLQTAG